MKHSAQFWVKDKEIKLCSPDLQMLQASMARFAHYDLMVNLFKEVIIGDGRIVDVGACIGAYSLMFHYAKPNSEIIALEPSSHNYAYLIRNTMHIPQIKQYELAASDRTETLTLSIPSAEKKSSTLTWGRTTAEL